jgi:hypothetical protein
MPRKKQIEVTNGMVESQVSTASADKTLIDQINEMRANNQTNTPEFVQKMRELEIVLGVSEISPFGTNELEIFEDNLQGLSLADMQKLANKVGVNPFHDRPTLKNTLIREFKAYARNSRRNIMPTAVNSFVPDPNNPKHQELLKILSDI